MDEEDAKRMRVLPLEDTTVELNNIPISDAVRSLLLAGESKHAIHSSREARLRVPVVTLEALAEQVRMDASCR